MVPATKRTIRSFIFLQSLSLLNFQKLIHIENVCTHREARLIAFVTFLNNLDSTVCRFGTRKAEHDNGIGLSVIRSKPTYIVSSFFVSGNITYAEYLHTGFLQHLGYFILNFADT